MSDVGAVLPGMDADGSERGVHPPPPACRWAWLPVPLLLAAIAALRIADLRGSYESPFLLVTLNFAFTLAVSVCIAFLAARSFIAGGQIGLLMLGCGVIVWGTAAVVASAGVERGADFTVSVHNLGVWISALCHLTGSLLAWRSTCVRRSPGRWLALGYLGAVGAVALIALAAMAGWTPTFFVQGQGGTPLRQLVLASAAAMFAVTAVSMLAVDRRAPSSFLRWYGLGLSLLAAGLLGVLLEPAHGGALSWTGRAGQYLGGAYMFVAAIASMRETGAWRIALDTARWDRRRAVWDDRLLRLLTPAHLWSLPPAWRYGLAIALVVLATASRWALLPWMGTISPYNFCLVTVVVTTVLLGIGPGLMSVLLSDVSVEWFITGSLRTGWDTTAMARLAIAIAIGVFIACILHAIRVAQIKARQGEVRLAAFADATFEGIVESEAGRIVDANEQFARMAGRSADELKGTEIADLIAPEDRERVIASIRDGRESVIEHAMLGRDGTRIIVEAHGRPVSPGGARRHTAVRDITDRRRAESEGRRLAEQIAAQNEELRSQSEELQAQNEELALQIAVRERAEAALRRSRDDLETVVGERTAELAATVEALRREARQRQAAQEAIKAERQRLYDVLETLPAMICLLTPDHHVAFANRSFRDRFGESRGRHCFEYCFGLTEPCEFCQTYRVLETGKPHRWEVTIPGGDAVIDAHDFPFTDVDGSPLILEMDIDITERKRAEAELVRHRHHLEELVGQRTGELEDAKAAAEAANEAKDRFLSVLSHELRTPLTPVLMAASALECDEAVPAWIREEMAMIRRSVGLEVKLIDDLLDLNRIMRGKLALRLEHLDAHPKIEAAIAICRPEAEAKSIAIAVDLAAASSRVDADAGRLQQIVWNLLKNSIKFTPDGGRIEMRTSNPAEGHLRIEVKDTGIGISPEAIPRLFEAFEQADRQVTSRFGGLGLGLAICKTLVDMHGGTISGTSGGPGTGATFAVDLPTVARGPRPGADAAAEGAPAAKKLRILCVEDHPLTARTIEKLLAKAGHEVRIAGSVREAVREASAHDFDVLVSDLGLPDGSGLDVLREVRARNPRVKAIALSGFGMEQDIERSQTAGFAEHITKPIEFRTLQAALTRIAGP